MNFYITDEFACPRQYSKTAIKEFRLYKHDDVKSAKYAIRVTIPDDTKLSMCCTKPVSYFCMWNCDWDSLKPTVMLRVDGRLRVFKEHTGLPRHLWGSKLKDWDAVMERAGHKFGATGWVFDPDAMFREVRDEKHYYINLAAENLIRAMVPNIGKRKIPADVICDVVAAVDGRLDVEFGYETCVPWSDEEKTPCWDINIGQCRHTSCPFKLNVPVTE